MRSPIRQLFSKPLNSKEKREMSPWGPAGPDRQSSPGSPYWIAVVVTKTASCHDDANGAAGLLAMAKRQGVINPFNRASSPRSTSSLFAFAPADGPSQCAQHGPGALRHGQPGCMTAVAGPFGIVRRVGGWGRAQRAPSGCHERAKPLVAYLVRGHAAPHRAGSQDLQGLQDLQRSAPGRFGVLACVRFSRHTPPGGSLRSTPATQSSGAI